MPKSQQILLECICYFYLSDEDVLALFAGEVGDLPEDVAEGTKPYNYRPPTEPEGLMD